MDKCTGPVHPAISSTPGLNTGPTCPMMSSYLDMPKWYAGYLPSVCDNRVDASGVRFA